MWKIPTERGTSDAIDQTSVSKGDEEVFSFFVQLTASSRNFADGP